jgi:hypothetical protein
MSIINLFGIKERLPGVVKNKSPNNPNFGHFSMETSFVKRSMAETVKTINNNLKAKKIDGELIFCEFVNHDGKFFLLS